MVVCVRMMTTLHLMALEAMRVRTMHIARVLSKNQ